MKKKIFLSKSQISVDFTSQSVDIFWTFLVKMDII